MVEYWFHECIVGSLADNCMEYKEDKRHCRRIKKYKEKCPKTVHPRRTYLTNNYFKSDEKQSKNNNNEVSVILNIYMKMSKNVSMSCHVRPSCLMISYNIFPKYDILYSFLVKVLTE